MLDPTAPTPPSEAAFEAKEPASPGRLLLIAFALFVAILLLAPGYGFSYDVWCWQTWSRAAQQGFAHVYEAPDCNYPPGALWAMGAIRSALPQGAEAPTLIKGFKAFWLLFDVASIYATMLLLRRLRLNPYLALLLLNPGFLFNSVVWCQGDGAIALSAGLAAWAALRNRPFWAALALSIGLAIKMQVIVFVPFVFFLCLPALRRRPVQMLSALAVASLPWAILSLPFVRAGTLGAMVRSLTGNGSLFPFVHLNAFNPWYVWAHGQRVPDTLRFLGLTLKAWGVLGFGLSFVGLMVALGLDDRSDEPSPSSIRVARVATAGGLVAMSFFLFCTEMHERYLHPAMLFLAVSAFVAGRYRAFVLVSLAVFLNEGTIFGVDAEWELLRSPRTVHLIATCVAVVLCVVFVQEFVWLAKGRRPSVQATNPTA